ncbi:unnamed protein product [Miscanthus lutarioriparius]|uniref:Methyltransferase domain-containing protein n=1 Tax=Miscanthus lutarioriparius TaxID=422564 RepID=A0A811MNU2_9POAL|nr:unnamed protein product [Miscanthus lutarioriparius]
MRLCVGFPAIPTPVGPQRHRRPRRRRGAGAAAISERALELLALPNDGVPKLLLDIGCGSGLSGETLMEHGHHWIGYDISKSMLDVALLMEESASRRAMIASIEIIIRMHG